MRVVEKDPMVWDMIHDEMERCREMVGEFERSTSGLPRGSLGVRKKRYRNREYSYHYLKYREKGKVVSQHDTSSDAAALYKRLELPRRYEGELRALCERIRYLEKLLSVGAG
jgi:hypothetical protein